MISAEYGVVNADNNAIHMTTHSESEANRFALRLSRDRRADYYVVEMRPIRRMYWCQECRASKMESISNGQAAS